MNNYILACESISKSYHNNGEKIEVLKNISLNFLGNKIYMLLGASGAGKSTLLHILGTLDKADSGKIFYEGTELSSLSQTRLNKFRSHNIGFVFQFHHLLPEFTALENVALAAMIAGESKKISFEKAKDILNQLNLSHRLNNKPAELSGGEQQRVAIARAIINNPKIVFADEPTGNLDSKNGEIINQIILDLKTQNNIMFIIATHNKELCSIGDVNIYMKDGVISSIEEK
ncbi:MAG TPA: ABC transporter ATP-binding protein [Ignavibacteriales bacterium]|nr:ABC transporter ATP-binding protein [Ignavibacteriales bacterium]HOL81282.1 ABC transporter ATP-binding protein [Ignavibacteriales bacterium]HOM66062.1 ABC transporter ATP-binding protein [Ignavibacteriales bacterium]HPD67554.1 ABC transporter ATP-binding protein [Ignavibacteriales bacterium]HPP33392.1 ABC transporter ATP-binding protein [Ignavibacteriales bacterium]